MLTVGKGFTKRGLGVLGVEAVSRPWCIGDVAVEERIAEAIVAHGLGMSECGDIGVGGGG